MVAKYECGDIANNNINIKKCLLSMMCCCLSSNVVNDVTNNIGKLRVKIEKKFKICKK